jgi:hypothetical protein
VNTSLVVLPLNGSASDRLQKRLAKRLRSKCYCPVLAVPRDVLVESNASSFSIHGLLSLLRQVCEGDRQAMKGLVRVSNRGRSQAPIVMVPKSAFFLRR